MSEAAPATEQASPGRALASIRAELKLSVADVSQQIKYSIRQIEAIEADDYAKLPGTTFVRGMIRSYAKLLQINPAPLLADLGRRDIPAPVTVDLRTGSQEPFVEGGGKSNRIYVLLSVAALVAVAVVAYEWWTNPLDTGEVVTVMPRTEQGDTGAARPAPAAMPAPAPAPPAPAQVPVPEAPAASDPPQAEQPAPTALPAVAAEAGSSQLKRIELEFDQISWVQIKQRNGKVLLSQLNPAGTMQVIEGEPPFEVVIGNAAKVRMKYKDEPVDLRPYFKTDVARLTLE
ncbi:MAG: helix-turn-helix domain-containing protein [Burkholderiales bacterium]|nr:helix-turn-helix domain-containing protein [Burkholderiales bacterium]